MNILQMLGNGLGRAGQAIGRGVGRAGEFLYPVDPNMVAEAGIGPEQLAQMRKAAMFRTGLGMMAGGEQGAGLGGSILAGLATGGDPFQQIITTSYGNAQKRRAEDKADTRYTEERNYKLERDKLEDERNNRIQDRLEQAQKDEQAYRERVLKLQKEGLGIKAVGAEEDRVKAEILKEQNARVKAILDKAEQEKRPLTTQEMTLIQAIRGNSLSTAMDPLRALLGGMGMGGEGMGLPGAGGAAVTPKAVMDAWRAPMR